MPWPMRPNGATPSRKSCAASRRSPRRVNEHDGKSSVRWQRRHYEHVIRNEKALDRIRAYIANNPARWADDPENISRAVCAEAGRV